MEATTPENVAELFALVENLAAEVESFKAGGMSNKASSARIRKMSLAIGKVGPAARSELVSMDKR